MTPEPLMFAVRVQSIFGICLLRQESVAQHRTRTRRDALAFVAHAGLPRDWVGVLMLVHS